jgi:pimeloyl-ACP methyl ester carboxylesterase
MTNYKTTVVDGLKIFFREAGNPARPALLLLHGFPASSFMFRELMRELRDDFHLQARRCRRDIPRPAEHP